MAKQIRSVYFPHNRLYTPITGPSRTKQSYQEESEINNIVKRYMKTGMLDHLAKYAGRYDDLPAAGDFHQAMNLITDANSMFEELPSAVRSRFGNDPAGFLDFVGNPENREEMVEMGLIRPEIATETDAEADPTEPVGDPTPEPEPPPAAP